MSVNTVAPQIGGVAGNEIQDSVDHHCRLFVDGRDELSQAQRAATREDVGNRTLGARNRRSRGVCARVWQR
ncbi:hypothetical protein [Gordonia sp. CNJ-863]|uniref:hypothetical protein n=1 Tax=Gordonia sp. CNJ-863 TaxID=1904963 RepID=UPI00096A6F52|nr:hypothetical protein [Gordonia sp. CNJ-863]